MELFKLFISFLRVGAFSFGGGYAMLPLLEREVIDIHRWMDYGEFLNIFAISEITPGPIAINAATFLGYRISGLVGAMVATFAVILPSFIIITLIYIFLSRYKNSPYIDWIFKGIRPMVLGFIGAAGITVSKNGIVDLRSFLVAVFIFYIVTFKKINPILGIIIAGIVGLVIY